MYLTMQLNPQPPGMDPTHAQVMKFMPLMIAGIFVIMPSGLVLYSVANSGISLVQQRLCIKNMGLPILIMSLANYDICACHSGCTISAGYF